MKDKTLGIVGGLVTVAGFVLTLVSNKITTVQNDRKMEQAAENAVKKLLENKKN